MSEQNYDVIEETVEIMAEQPTEVSPGKMAAVAIGLMGVGALLWDKAIKPGTKFIKGKLAGVKAKKQAKKQELIQAGEQPTEG